MYYYLKIIVQRKRHFAAWNFMMDAQEYKPTRIPGRCAGPAIREIGMKWGRYYTLLRITTYLLIARIMKEVLSFLLCKWDYIVEFFFLVDQWNKFTEATF